MTLFSKIIRGEIPSYKVFEDEHTFAFLDIRPVQIGHTLVVPKVEIDFFADVPEPFYSAVFRTGKILAPALRQVTGCVRVGTTIQGFEVPHFHLHLVPMWNADDLDFRKAKPAKPEDLQRTQSQILAKTKQP